MVSSMKHMRVTKYNPANRNDKGHYMADEWIAATDIYENISGHVLTLEEYVRVENAYIDAVLRFMRLNEIAYLNVQYIEKRAVYWHLKIINRILISRCKEYKCNPHFIKECRALKRIIRKIKLDSKVYYDDVSDLIRLNLRSILWCKLVHEDTMYVHFGYDYYMYIGSQRCDHETTDAVTRSGLYVEDFVSPYLKKS